MRRAFPCARALLLTSLAGGCLAGCADSAGSEDEQIGLSDQEQGEPSSTASDTQPFSAFEATADAGTVTPDGGPASASTSPAARADAGLDYSDQQILGVALAMHEGAVVLATAAQWNATDPGVQSLATDVVAAHREGQVRALALDTVPLPSDQSAIYFEAGLVLRATLLREDRGETYDDAYLNVQIMLDATIVHQIETIWLPMVEAPEVRSELEATRDTMQSHLDRAVALRTERHPPGSNQPPDAGPTEPSEETSPTDQPAADDEAPPTDNADGGEQPEGEVVAPR